MIAAVGLAPSLLARSSTASATKPAPVNLQPESRAVPRKEGSC
ncbi:MAG TPA: hypothetical protein VF388_00615 [Lacunisphaera sp.]